MSPKSDPFPSDAPAPILWLEDLWDFSYCPLKWWWKRNRSEAGVEVSGPDVLSGEDLFRQSMQQSVSLFYRLRDLGKPVTYPEAVDYVWNAWTKEWGLADLRSELADFRKRHSRLLDAFSASGGIRNEKGLLYSRPTMTKKWKEMAQACNLYELRRKIESFHSAVGLPSLETYEDTDPDRPIGLAEAYAIAAESSERNDRNNAFPDSAVSVGSVLVMDLHTIRLQMKADLVLPAGISRGRGRPRADRTDETEELIYELHLYEENVAPPQSLAHDIRLLAMLESRPANWPADRPFRVNSVMVRHMRSGQLQPFTPRKSSSVNLLETLMRGLQAAQSQGVIIPRCLQGWIACADCSLRPRCFAGEGVLVKNLPGSTDQMRLDQESASSLLRILPQSPAERKLVITIFDALLQWMADKGLSPARIAWALRNIQEDKPR